MNQNIQEQLTEEELLAIIKKDQFIQISNHRISYSRSELISDVMKSHPENPIDRLRELKLICVDESAPNGLFCYRIVTDAEDLNLPYEDKEEPPSQSSTDTHDDEKTICGKPIEAVRVPRHRYNPDCPIFAHQMRIELMENMVEGCND